MNLINDSFVRKLLGHGGSKGCKKLLDTCIN